MNVIWFPIVHTQAQPLDSSEHLLIFYDTTLEISTIDIHKITIISNTNNLTALKTKHNIPNRLINKYTQYMNIIVK